MKRFAFLFVAVVLATSAARSEQLVCLDQPPANACVRFHYHVEAWNPATNAFEELTGLNQFATMDQCDAARTIESRRNIGAIDSLLTADGKSNAQPNRFGPCHCDMTIAPSNQLYLTDAARESQQLRYRELTRHLRDSLIAAGISPTSEVAAALLPPAVVSPAPPAAPPVVPAPVAAAPPAAGAEPDSKIVIHWSKDRPAGSPPDPAAAGTDAAATTPPAATDQAANPPATPPSAPPAAVVSATPGTSAPADTTATAPPTTPAAEPPAIAPPTIPPPAQPVAATPVTTLPAGSPATVPAATPSLGSPDVAVTNPPAAPTSDPASPPIDPDAAEPFINYEIARVQQILTAGNSVTDDATKARIFQAAMERLQLLSNLREIASSDSGVKVRESIAAIHGEPARLDFIGRVFGPFVQPHWWPSDAKEVVVPAPDDIAANPAAIMNDPARPISDRKLALYEYLTKNQSLAASDEIRLAGLIAAYAGQ